VVTPQLTALPDPAAPREGVAQGANGSIAPGDSGAMGDSSGARYPRNRVLASAEIVAAAAADGVTRLPVLRSQAPLVLRRTPDAVYLVGGAAGPIGGDSLDLRIEVRDGAALRVRTAAAAVALPGLDGLESVLTITATVGPGARLEYLPEPVVVSAGARHATVIQVTLAEGASLLLRDELILGRHGEPGGVSRTSLRVDYAGRPLLRQTLEVSGTDEASLGPAILAGHRAAGTLLHVDPAVRPDAAFPAGSGARADAGSAPREATRYAGRDMAVMPLAGPGVLVTALARDAVTLRKRLHAPGSVHRHLTAQELNVALG
jgi:urease accessory protein